MDDDSRITRLREYIQLYLRREMKENMHEQHGIQFFLKEIITEFGKSPDSSAQKDRFSEDTKAYQSNFRNKKANRKIEEEIGRSHSTIDINPIQNEDIFDDLRIEIYPIGTGVMAVIKNSENKKVSKFFPDEESANIWVRTNSLKLSNKFTQ